MEIENIEAIKSLVGAGLGAAILPRCTVAESGQGSAIKVMTVRQKLFRKLGLVRREGTMPPPAIEELWKALMAGLGPPGGSHR
jgi:DNA-binding transcriptional LysR family regulator